MGSKPVIDVGIHLDIGDFLKNFEIQLDTLANQASGKLSKSAAKEVAEIKSQVSEIQAMLNQLGSSKMNTTTFNKAQDTVLKKITELESRTGTLEDSMMSLINTMSKADGGKFANSLKETLDVMNGAIQTSRDFAQAIGTVRGAINHAPGVNLVTKEDNQKLRETLSLLEEISKIADIDNLSSVSIGGSIDETIEQLRTLYNTYKDLNNQLENTDVGSDQYIILQKRVAEAAKAFIDLREAAGSSKDSRKYFDFFSDMKFDGKIIDDIGIEIEDRLINIRNNVLEQIEAINKIGIDVGNEINVSDKQDKLSVPLNISTGINALKKQAIDLIDRVQPYLVNHPLEVEFTLVSALSTQKANAALKKLKSQIGNIDNDGLKAELQETYDVIAKDLGKELTINISSNIDKEKSNIEAAIEDIRKNVMSDMFIFPKVFLDEEERNKIQSSLDELADTLTLTINKIQIDKNELQKAVDDASKKNDKKKAKDNDTISFSTQDAQALGVALDEITDRIREVHQELPPVWQTLVDIRELLKTFPIDEIVSSTQKFVEVLQQAYHILSNDDLDNMFSGIKSSVEGITGSLRGKNLETIKQVLADFKEYQSLGGQKKIEELGGSDNIQKWLQKNIDEQKPAEVKIEPNISGFGQQILNEVKKIEPIEVEIRPVIKNIKTADEIVTSLSTVSNTISQNNVGNKELTTFNAKINTIKQNIKKIGESWETAKNVAVTNIQSINEEIEKCIDSISELSGNISSISEDFNNIDISKSKLFKSIQDLVDQKDNLHVLSDALNGLKIVDSDKIKLAFDALKDEIKINLDTKSANAKINNLDKKLDKLSEPRQINIEPKVNANEFADRVTDLLSGISAEINVKPNSKISSDASTSKNTSQFIGKTKEELEECLKIEERYYRKCKEGSDAYNIRKQNIEIIKGLLTDINQIQGLEDAKTKVQVEPDVSNPKGFIDKITASLKGYSVKVKVQPEVDETTKSGNSKSKSSTSNKKDKEYDLKLAKERDRKVAEKLNQTIQDLDTDNYITSIDRMYDSHGYLVQALIRANKKIETETGEIIDRIERLNVRFDTGQNVAFTSEMTSDDYEYQRKLIAEQNKQAAKDAKELAESAEEAYKSLIDEQKKFDNDQTMSEHAVKLNHDYTELTETIRRYVELTKRMEQGNGLKTDAEEIADLDTKIIKLMDDLEYNPLFNETMADKAWLPMDRLKNQIKDIRQRALEREEQEQQEAAVTAYYNKIKANLEEIAILEKENAELDYQYKGNADPDGKILQNRERINELTKENAEIEDNLVASKLNEEKRDTEIAIQRKKIADETARMQEKNLNKDWTEAIKANKELDKQIDKASKEAEKSSLRSLKDSYKQLREDLEEIAKLEVQNERFDAGLDTDKNGQRVINEQEIVRLKEESDRLSQQIADSDAQDATEQQKLIDLQARLNREREQSTYQNKAELINQISGYADTLDKTANKSNISGDFRDSILNAAQAMREYVENTDLAEVSMEELIQKAREFANQTDSFTGMSGMVADLKKMRDQLNQKLVGADDKYTQDYVKRLRDLQDELDHFDTSKGQQALDELKQKLKTTFADSSLSEFKKPLESTLANLQLKIRQFQNNNSAMGADFQRQFDNLSIKLETAQSQVEVRNLKAEISSLEAEVNKAGKTGKSFMDQMFASIKSKNAQLLAYYFSFQDIIRYARTAFNTIRELDYALVDLAKTTKMSQSEMNQFYFSANDIAKQTGVTTKEIISQAAAWSRLNNIGLLYGDI